MNLFILVNNNGKLRFFNLGFFLNRYKTTRLNIYIYNWNNWQKIKFFNIHNFVSSCASWKFLIFTLYIYMNSFVYFDSIYSFFDVFKNFIMIDNSLNHFLKFLTWVANIWTIICFFHRQMFLKTILIFLYSFYLFEVIWWSFLYNRYDFFPSPIVFYIHNKNIMMFGI